MLDYEFNILLPIHYDEVIQFLQHNFFADEPLNKSLKMTQKGESHPELERHSLTTLADGISLGVWCNGKICAVMLNGFLYQGDILIAKEKLNQDCNDEKFKKIFNLLYDENLKIDLFKSYNVEKIFELRILSVSDSCRGKGIGKQLFVKSEDIARKYQCKLMKADATSCFSAYIAASLGYLAESEIDYNSIGFPVEKPHEKLKIMCKNLGD